MRLSEEPTILYSSTCSVLDPVLPTRRVNSFPVSPTPDALGSTSNADLDNTVVFVHVEVRNEVLILLPSSIVSVQVGEIYIGIPPTISGHFFRWGLFRRRGIRPQPIELPWLFRIPFLLIILIQFINRGCLKAPFRAVVIVFQT